MQEILTNIYNNISFRRSRRIVLTNILTPLNELLTILKLTDIKYDCINAKQVKHDHIQVNVREDGSINFNCCLFTSPENIII
jgi:hypothetical protein